MTKTTMTEAVETLRSLIDEDAVFISDGAENWEIANLIDALRVDDDGELQDLAVSEDGITRVDEAGYLESIPVYKVVSNESGVCD